MIRNVILFFLLVLLISCKNDKPVGTLLHEVVVEESLEEENLSKEVYAIIDRLRIRTDSTLNASTAITITEGDTLIYLDEHSTNRLTLKLRGQYYHQPWLKVLHTNSQKQGWVYGGAVSFDDDRIESQVNSSSVVLEQIAADDLEWAGTVPTSWQTATIKSGRNFKMFLIGFKQMVAEDDISEISKLVSYPIKDLRSPADFRESYHRIFTDELKAKVKGQRYDQIFRNSQGAMIGDGDLWFQELNGTYRIVSLNYKGRDDIMKELMTLLSGEYTPQNAALDFRLQAYPIKRFLELRLFSGAEGSQGESMGRYVYSSTQSGAHYFDQDTAEPQKRQLVFRKTEQGFQLQIDGIPTIAEELFYKN